MPLTRSRAKRSTVPTPATSSDDVVPVNTSKSMNIDELHEFPSMTNKKRSVAKRTKVQLDEPSSDDEVTLQHPLTKKRTLVSSGDAVGDAKPAIPLMKPTTRSTKQTSSTKPSSSVSPISNSQVSKSLVKDSESSDSNLTAPSSSQVVPTNNKSIDPLTITVSPSVAAPDILSSFKGIDVYVARRIWRYLDAGTLSRLYATFDFSVQRLLCTSHGLDHVTLLSHEATPLWQLWMFLKSVRNVKSLQLQNVTWTAFELSTILRKANPQELVLGDYLVLEPVVDALNRIPTAVEDEESALECFTSLMLPDFTVLTPRLERLRFSGNPAHFSVSPDFIHFGHGRPRWMDQARGLGTSPFLIYFPLPLSLQSLQLDLISISDLTECVKHLPKTLTSFKANTPLDRDRNLPSRLDCGPYLPLLETYEWNDHDISDRLEMSAAWPKTLTDLSLGTFHRFPSKLLCPSFRELPLVRLTLDLPARVYETPTVTSSPDIFLENLPPTLQYMKLSVSSEDRYASFRVIESLPTQLREVWLDFHDCHPWLPASLSSLRRLEKLTLDIRKRDKFFPIGEAEASDPDIMSLRIRALPSNLKTLVLRPSSLLSMRGNPFEFIPIECIPSFPASLTALTLPCCDLVWAKEFHEHWPNTSLTISEPVDVWTSPNGKLLQAEFPTLWAPELITSTFERTVHEDYTGMNILLCSRLASSN